MRVAIIGLGVQGHKRKAVAGSDVAAVVDPVRAEASHKDLKDVPLASFDAALVCTPDEVKLGLISYLIAKGKHVLVEKPLIADTDDALVDLERRVREHGVTCYVAYNHRFEPNVARLRDVLASGQLGQIYTVRLFYGNGTARLVRDSAWRDAGSGVLRDLGCHLIDLTRFWFPDLTPNFDVVAANRFENRAYDHVVIASRGHPYLQLEMSLLSWKNHFACDVLAEKGSAHIDSLCKWGASTFTVRTRVLPAGRPAETTVTEVGPDPTWEREYAYFKELCRNRVSTIAGDVWLNRTLNLAARDAEALAVGGPGRG